MEKINFVNNSEPYLSAENLNQLQTNIENEIKKLKVRFKNVTGLTLEAGASYQLDLPDGVIFIEPLVQCSGSDYSGGQFITPDESYTYITNNDLEGQYRGIWIRCDYDGTLNISEYKHCGAIIKGFRIWYIGTE